MKQQYNTIIKLINSLQPAQPLFVYRPHIHNKAVKCFLNNFNADCLYAVKTNPEAHIINSLYKLGIKHFDVASLYEIQLVKNIAPNAKLYFMHPVKSRKAIAEAYFKHNIKHFSLDSHDELNKILQETKNATDLCLHLRLTIPNNHAVMKLTHKFGIALKEAIVLLRCIKKVSHKVGVCFHVGSQCMHPDSYKIALNITAKVTKEANVKINFINVGGGFPSIYPHLKPPKITDYFNTINSEFIKIKASLQQYNLKLLAEPGRALVAETTSMIVKVELRKNNTLYINDGIYGSLFDAGLLKFIFPVKKIMWKSEIPTKNYLLAYSFYGPTCDSLDYMPGPFLLPSNITEGDYIEIGQIGAYGRALATKFNGFHHNEKLYEVTDQPIMSMYNNYQDKLQELKCQTL